MIVEAPSADELQIAVVGLAEDASLTEDQRRRAAVANRSAREAARIIQESVDVASSDEINWGVHGRTLRVRG